MGYDIFAGNPENYQEYSAYLKSIYPNHKPSKFNKIPNTFDFQQPLYWTKTSVWNVSRYLGVLSVHIAHNSKWYSFIAADSCIRSLTFSWTDRYVGQEIIT